MEFEDIDRPGNLVHGTYLENFPRILRAGGIFPSNMLPLDLQPLRGYKRRPLNRETYSKSRKKEMISTVVLYENSYGHEGSLSEQKLWGDPALFHFHIVSNYDFRDLSKSSVELHARFGNLDLTNYPEPYYTEDSEVALVNQGLPLETFVGLVVPTDEMIQNHSTKTLNSVFGSRSKGKRDIMTAQEIAERLQDKLSVYNHKNIPIFYFDGKRFNN